MKSIINNIMVATVLTIGTTSANELIIDPKLYETAVTPMEDKMIQSYNRLKEAIKKKPHASNIEMARIRLKQLEKKLLSIDKRINLAKKLAK